MDTNCESFECHRMATINFFFPDDKSEINFCEFHAGVNFGGMPKDRPFQLGFFHHSSDMRTFYEKAGNTFENKRGI